MRGEASTGVLKVWIYAAASTLLGAWFSPLLYNAGKALAEVSDSKQTNGPLEWLAGLCRTSGFPAFFTASLLISAAVLFLPFIEWLRGKGNGEPGRSSGGLRLPAGAPKESGGQPLRKNPAGAKQFLTGFVCVAVLFLIIAVVLMLAGVSTWKSPPGSPWRLAGQVLTGAVGLAVLQELLFRGLAMGIFLRAMRPAAAAAVSAALFACVLFLKPPAGMNVVDPDAGGVGFELLGMIAARFSEPDEILGTFAPLLALGAVLAFARWRTASLWLPAGIHAGWLFTTGMLAWIAVPGGSGNSLMWILCGSSLKQGLVPMVAIILTGILTNHPAFSHDAARHTA